MIGARAHILRRSVPPVVRDWAARCGDGRPDRRAMDSVALFYADAVAGDFWDDLTILFDGSPVQIDAAKRDVKGGYVGVLQERYGDDGDLDESRGPTAPGIGYVGDGNVYWDTEKTMGSGDLPGLDDPEHNLSIMVVLSNLSQAIAGYGATGGGVNYMHRERNSFVAGFWNNVADQQTISVTTALGVHVNCRTGASSGFGAQVLFSETYFDASTYGDWQTGQSYAVGALKRQSNAVYTCLVAHTSGTFNTDLGAGKWEKLANVGDISSTASSLPTGTMRYMRGGQAAAPFSGNTYALYAHGPGTDFTIPKAILLMRAVVRKLRRLGVYDSVVQAAAAYNRVQPSGRSFTAAADAALVTNGIEFYQYSGGRPTEADSSSQIYKPYTHYVSRPESMNLSDATWPKFKQLLWINRALGDPATATEANPYPQAYAKKPNDCMGILRNAAGKDCRPQHSRYTRGDAATLAQIAYTGGALPFDDPRLPGNRGWVQIAEHGGYDVAYWYALRNGDPGFASPIWTTDVNVDSGPLLHKARAVAGVETIFTADDYDAAGFKVPAKTGGPYADGDIIVLGPARLVDDPIPNRSVGIKGDTETQDNRSPAQFLAYMTDCAAVCAGLDLDFDLTPLDLRTMSRSGLTVDNGYLLLDDPNITSLSILMDKNSIGDDFDAFIADRLSILKGPLGDQAIPFDKITVQVNFGIEDPRNTAYSNQVTEAQFLAIKAWALDNGINKFIPRNIGEFFGGGMPRGINQGLAILGGLNRYAAT